jgi:hypothetical protein
MIPPRSHEIWGPKGGYQAADGRFMRAYRKDTEIRLAELLMDRIIADDYGLDEFMAHQAKWRLERPGHRLLNRDHLSDEKKKQEERELRWLFEKEDILQNQDLDFLFRHLRKHLRTWWD